MKNIASYFAVVALLGAASLVSAQTVTVPDAVGPNLGDMKFNGTITASCNLQSFVDGIVIANTNQTTLSSKLSGGAAATVQLRVNTNGYTLVLGSPTLTGPNGVEKDVTVVLTSVGTGTDLVGVSRAAFSATAGKMLFDNGIYRIVLNGDATKNVGAFAAGTYVLKVPVTCVSASTPS